jgi:hypothetical protein
MRTVFAWLAALLTAAAPVMFVYGLYGPPDRFPKGLAAAVILAALAAVCVNAVVRLGNDT